MNTGNGGSLIILALPLLLIAWMFWSANRRQKQMRAFSDSLGVGDRVVTSSGIYGTIRHLGDTTAHLEVAQGTIIEVDRRALSMKQPEATQYGSTQSGTTNAADDASGTGQ